MEEKSFGPLTLSFNRESGELTATYTPADGEDAPNLAVLTKALLDSGYQSMSPDRDTVKAFVDSSASAKEPISRIIAKRRDGEFKLIIADDKMAAYLTIVPPNGGRAKNVEIIRAIHEKGITNGLKHDVLRDAIKSGQCEQLLIAEGILPTLGNPTEFRSLLEELEEQLTEIDDNAIVHYNEIGHFLIVNPGDKIMEKIPPVQGVEGKNIFGEPVPTRNLPDIPFNRDCSGVKPHPENPNILITEIAGQPKLISNGAKINNIVEIENVDLSTGNIKFDGSLNVKGDIKSGMRVDVTGDVIVAGMVEAASITAGGNIVVKGGVIGAGDNLQQQQQPVSGVATTAFFKSAGNIQVMFAQNATFKATKSIMISDTSTQCDLAAGEEIIIGKSRGGGKGGTLVGGRAHATSLIQANSLGSNSGTRTVLVVGDDPSWSDKVVAADRALQRSTKDLDETIKSLLHMKTRNASPKDMQAMENRRKELVDEVKQRTEALQEIKDSHVPPEQCRIVASKALHEGVEIRIGKQLWAVTSDNGAGTARLQNDKINFGK